MSDFLLVLDEGTTSTRAVLYAADGTIHGVSHRELAQHNPAPRLADHDVGQDRQGVTPFHDAGDGLQYRQHFVLGFL